MVQLRAGRFDTEDSLFKCDHCKETVYTSEPKILIGTGNSLLIVLHARCWEGMIFDPKTTNDEHNH